VPSMPGLAVTSHGDVFDDKGRKLPKHKTAGYLGVCYKNNKLYIHRLVAEAWCGGLPSGLIVNHKNGDRHDNRAENLEWVTHRENLRHAVRIGLNGRFSANQMQAIIDDHAAGLKLGDITKKHKVSKSMMYNILHGKQYGEHNLDRSMARVRLSSMSDKASLTADEVVGVFADSDSGMSRAEISRKYGVDFKTVNMVLRGLAYRVESGGLVSKFMGAR